MDPRVTEFQSIMPLANIPSVMKYGILSYEMAARRVHESVAMPAVQDRRDVKQVPRGMKLHQYANLYFHARNPMLYKRKEHAGELCVLRVSLEILTIKGVVFSDSNASSDYARFLDPCQWELLDFDDIYAEDWRHPHDQIAYYRHRSRKCAEVLVPERVEPRFLLGAYVVNPEAMDRLVTLDFQLPIQVDPPMFFQ